MAEYRQASIGTSVTTVGGEVVLGKRVFGYIIITDGVNAAKLELFLTDSSGTKIWEHNVPATNDDTVVSFAEAPIGDPNNIQPVAALVTGTGAVTFIRNH